MFRTNSNYFKTHDRYTCQGQEMDKEVKGEGNSVNYKYRMHDPRLGRFFAIDPLAKKYPWNSVYAFSENKVIAWAELEGMEIFYSAGGERIGQYGTSTEVRVVQNSDVAEFKNELASANHSRSEYYRIKKGLDNGWYKTEDKKANAESWKKIRGTECWKFKKGAMAEKSTSTGMTEEELNTRIFLGVIKQTEAGMKNPPLEYNDHNRGDNFTEKTFEQAPQDYAKHPGDNPNVPGPGTAAGAYQFTKDTYSRTGVTSFSPESQDRAAVIWIGKVKFLDKVKTGNFESFVFTPEFKGQWDSFNYISNETLNKLIETNRVLELTGQSKLAVKPGKTL